MQLLDKLVNKANQIRLMENAHKRHETQCTLRSIQIAVRLIICGGLAKHSVFEGIKAVTRVINSGKRYQNFMQVSEK